MLKRKIKYENFDGEEVSEEFYFNLSKAELIEMEVEYQEGFTTKIQAIIDAQDRKELVKQFKELVLKSYGMKSEDGKRFIKSEQLREEFSQTAAYSTLFMELATDDKLATAFIKGILPRDMGEEVEKAHLQEATVAALSTKPEENPSSA